MERQNYETEFRANADTAPVEVEGKTQVGNFNYKQAAVLCYLPVCAINLVASLIFLNSEPKENTFVRFHATQSLVMMVAFMVIAIAVWTASLVLGFIPFIGGLFVLVANLIWLVASVLFIWQSVVALIAANRGEMKHIPYAGQIAEERLAQ